MASKVKRLFGKIKKILFGEEDAPMVESLIYTQDLFKDTRYNIGVFTYGKPNILFDHTDAQLVIGKYCSIAEKVSIFLGGNHRYKWVTTYPFTVLHRDLFADFPESLKTSATKGDVIIGNDVWICYQATILSGVRIGDGAVIAAGSVVSRDIGPYEIWAGNPAKFIKKRFTDEQISKLLKIKWWEWNDDQLKKRLNSLCSENIDEFLAQADKNL